MTITDFDIDAAVEARYAHGDLPHEIARRFSLPVKYVEDIGDRMDDDAHHVDDPAAEAALYGVCSNNHVLSPDNIVSRNDNRRSCLQCRRDRDRARQVRMKERRAS